MAQTPAKKTKSADVKRTTPVRRRAKAIGSVLQVTVIDGKYYCACTDQNPTTLSASKRPQIKMDADTAAALEKLGVKIKQES